MSGGGLAKLRLVMEIDGDKAVVTGLERVDAAVDRASRSTTAATGRMAADMASMETASGRMAQMTERVAVAAAAMLAAWKLGDLIRDAALLAARVETLSIVMKVVGNNAGYTGDQMEEYRKQVAVMGITTKESTDALIKMASAQMDLSKAAQLARVAQDAAVIGGVNSSEAFGRIIHGIRSAEVEVLRTIGINVNFEESYKRLAAQLGKTSAQLTDQEKTQARLNVVLQYGANLQGAYEASMGTAGKQITSMSRYLEELALKLGEAFSPVLTALVKDLTEALKNLDKVAGASREEKSGFAGWLVEMWDLAKREGNMVVAWLDKLNAALYRSVQLNMELAKRSPLGMNAKLNAAAEEASYNLGGRADQLGRDYQERMKKIQEYDRKYRGADGYDDTLDPSDRARLHSGAHNKQEAARIAAGNEARKAAEETARLAEANDKAKKAAKEAEQEYKRYLNTLDGFNAQVRAANPHLSDHEKKLLDIDAAVSKAVRDNPKYVESLREAGEALKHNTKLAHEMAEAIRATSIEFQAYLYQVENQPAQHGDLGGRLLMYEDEMAQVKALQPTAEIDQLREQIETLKKVMDSIPERADQVGAAIETLKQRMRAATDWKLEDLQIAGIKDPYAQQMAQMEARYRREKQLLKENLKYMKEGSREQIQGLLTLNQLERNEAKDTATLKRQMWADSLGAYGDMLGAMSSAIDTNSRAGFEASKAFAVGATIMNTAASIMAQTAGPDGWTPAAWARAITVGIIGVAQIAKIMSTSYGSSGSAGFTLPSGSFGSSGGAGSAGVSSGIGSPDRAIRDTVTDESLRTAALSMENASLAMTKVADGLTKVTDALEDGSLLAMAVGAAPGKGTAVGKSELQGVYGTLLFPNLFPKMDIGTFFNMPLTLLKNTWSAMFGRGPWTATGSGIELGIDRGGFAGRQYTDWFSKGGWFRKDRHRTDYAPLDEGFEGAMEVVIGQIKASLLRAAVAMGTTTDFSQANIGLARIATAGRSTEDILKDVENWLVSVSGTLAMTMEGLGDFAFYGENAFDAAMRLVTALQAMNEGMELLGRGKIESTLFGANAAYKLQELMGGAEKAQEKIEAYFEAMFTEPQQDALRLEQYTRQIAVAFREMGAGVPMNRDTFNALVKSQDLTTERGRAMFAALMDIADVFAKRIELEEKLADVQREQIELLAERTSAREDLMVRYLQASGYEQTANLLGLWIDQQREYKEWVEKGYDTTELLKVQAVEWSQAMAQVGAAMRQTKISILETIISLRAGEQSILSPEAKYRELQAQFRATEDPEKLKTLATQYLSASRGYNASGAGYVADFNEVMDRLGGLIGMDDVATQQLSVLQLQLEQLKQLNESLSNSRESGDFLAQLASGDVPMGALMQMLWRGGDLSSGNIGDLFEATRESAMAMAEKFRQGALAQGLSADLAQKMYDIGMRLNGFAVGSPGIPYDQVAMVHAGEKIIDAQSSAILSRYGIRVQAASADNRETVAELRALRDEVKALRAEVAANTRVSQYVGGKVIESGERTAEASETTARYIRREANNPGVAA